MEIETHKLCQTTWFVKPLRKICKLTYWGHDPTLTWTDLRSDFETDLSRSNSTWSKPTRRGEHDGVILIFIFLISKKSYQWKTISGKNDNFSFDDLWSQNCWPYVKSDRKRCCGMKSAFFEFFLVLILLEIISIACEKTNYFLKIWPSLTFGDLNIDLT